MCASFIFFFTCCCFVFYISATSSLPFCPHCLLFCPLPDQGLIRAWPGPDQGLNRAWPGPEQGLIRAWTGPEQGLNSAWPGPEQGMSRTLDQGLGCSLGMCRNFFYKHFSLALRKSYLLPQFSIVCPHSLLMDCMSVPLGLHNRDVSH